MAFTTLQPQPISAVIDTNILFSPSLRNLLMHIASEGLFLPFIPLKCLEELERVITREKPQVTSPKEYVQHFKDNLQNHFEDALVRVTRRQAEQVALPDPDDRHVLAAAIKAKATHIVTNNLEDFPAVALKPHGIVALSADEFVLQLITHDANIVLQGASTHWKSLMSPPQSLEQYLNALHNAGLKKSRRWLHDQMVKLG